MGTHFRDGRATEEFHHQRPQRDCRHHDFVQDRRSGVSDAFRSLTDSTNGTSSQTIGGVTGAQNRAGPVIDSDVEHGPCTRLEAR
jgi:hypothetical protein